MAISKRTITVLVRNYLLQSPRMKLAIEIRLMNFMDVFARLPTNEESIVLLRSLVITDYAGLYADTIYLAKEEGLPYPAEYATQLLEDITATNWESLVSIVRNIAHDMPVLAS